MKRFKYYISLLMSIFLFQPFLSLCASAASSTVFYEYKPEAPVPPSPIPNTALDSYQGIVIAVLCITAVIAITIFLVSIRRERRRKNEK